MEEALKNAQDWCGFMAARYGCRSDGLESIVLEGLVKASQPILRQYETPIETVQAFREQAIAWARNLGREHFALEAGDFVAQQFQQRAEDALIGFVAAWVKFSLEEVEFLDEDEPVLDPGKPFFHLAEHGDGSREQIGQLSLKVIGNPAHIGQRCRRGRAAAKGKAAAQKG